MSSGSPRSEVGILQAAAQQYADDPTFKADLDRMFGVFHLPPHRPGACEGCDKQRAKGGLKDFDRKADFRD